MADGDRQATTAGAGGGSVSNLQESQSQPLLSGAIGALARVRRSQHAESSLGLAPLEQETSSYP